jgi:hypothetical protein
VLGSFRKTSFPDAFGEADERELGARGPMIAAKRERSEAFACGRTAPQHNARLLGADGFELCNIIGRSQNDLRALLHRISGPTARAYCMHSASTET